MSKPIENTFTKILAACALQSALALTFAPPASANCPERYREVADHDEQIMKKYEGTVESQDERRRDRDFENKVRRSGINPFELVYSVLSQPSDNYKNTLTWQREVPDNVKREFATRLMLEHRLIYNILIDSFYFAVENESFVRLMDDIHSDDPSFNKTPYEVAEMINAADWRGSFCLEEPKTVFVKNQFDKLYSTEILTLQSYESIRRAIEMNAWIAEPAPQPQPPTLVYPQNPLNNRP